MDVHVEERKLGRGLCGLYCDALRLIIIDNHLLDHQKLCTLCHELVHARHHDPGCGIIGAKTEQRTRKETALWLVGPSNMRPPNDCTTGTRISSRVSLA